MSSTKVEKAASGPSWTEIILGIILSVSLGVVLCAAWLVLKPVATVKAIPKDAPFGQVYYIEGMTNAKRGAKADFDQFVAGRLPSLSLGEGELNTFLVPAVDPAKQAAATGTLVPGPLNYRLDASLLQVACPVQIPLLGVTVVVQARGTFEKQGEAFAFVPASFLVGSFPIARIPGATGFVLGKLGVGQGLGGKLAADWDKLNSVTVENRALKLAR